MVIVGSVLVAIGIMLVIVANLNFPKGNVSFWTSMSAPFSKARDYLHDPGPALLAVGRALSMAGIALLWLSLFVGLLS